MNDESERNTFPKHDYCAWWNSLFFAILSLGLVALGRLDRPRFDELMWEDAAGEWATFFAFALAGAIGVFALFRAISSQSDAALKENQFWFRMIMAGLSVFCWMAAGEEISWGQRLFGFMPPDIFQEKNFQQEFNLHNILVFVVSPRMVIATICFGYGVILPWIAAYFRFEQESSSVHLTELAAPRLYLVPWFLFAGVAYWTDWPLAMVSAAEAVEMLLGLLLLADVMAKTKLLGVASFEGTKWGTSLKQVCILALVLILGIIANPVLEKIWFGEDREKVEQAQIELTAIGMDLSKESRIQENLIKSNHSVGSRIFHATRMGWLHFDDQGHFRTESGKQKSSDLGRRQTYFLDPWNNAYWIRMRGREPVFLYSFGPNRRLDTVMDHYDGVPTKAQLKGDDIGIWIEPKRISGKENGSTGD